MKCIWQKKVFRVVLRMCLFVDCWGFWQKLWWNTISMRHLPCLQRKSQLTWPIIKAENHSSSLLPKISHFCSCISVCNTWQARHTMLKDQFLSIKLYGFWQYKYLKIGTLSKSKRMLSTFFFVLNEDSWSANVKKSDRHTEEQRMLSLQDSKLPFIFCLLTSLLVWVILLAQWTKVMGEDIWGN